MKFITSALTLLAATSAVIAVPVNNSTSTTDVSKLRGDLSNNEVAKTFSKECKEALEKSDEFMQCFFIDNLMTLEHVKGYCQLTHTEKCKKFYEKPDSFIPEACKKEEKLTKLLEPVDGVIAQSEAMCRLDGNGKLCRLAKYTFNKKGFDSVDVYDTCESKICATNFLNFFKTVEKNTPLFKELYPDRYKDANQEDMSGLKKYIDFLGSDKCNKLVKDSNTNTKLAHEVEGDITSGAIKNYSTMFSVVVVALLYNLLF